MWKNLKRQFKENFFIEIARKVWGLEGFIVNSDYCTKVLVLKSGFQCSLHYHKLKDEVFIILCGKVRMELNNKIYVLRKGDYMRVKPGDVHRFTGVTWFRDSIIVESSSTHKDKDTYRYEKSRKVRSYKKAC